VGEQVGGQHDVDAFFIGRDAGPGWRVDEPPQAHLQVGHLLDAVEERLLAAVALRLLFHTDDGVVVVDSDEPAPLEQLLAELAHVYVRSLEIVLEGVVKIAPIDEDHHSIRSVQ